MPITATSMPTGNLLTLHSRLPIAASSTPAAAWPVSCGVHGAQDARHLSKGFGLDIRPGEFVAIVGREGSGKSALLRLLAGMAALPDGQDARDRDGMRAAGDGTRQEAGAQSYLLRPDDGLSPWKQVLANVAVGPAFDARNEAIAALRRVGMAEHWAQWPTALSESQQLRASLARALVRRPGLLLLDEPLSKLDAAARRDIRQLIEGLWRRDRFTVVLATRDAGEALALADRILVVKEDQVVLNQRVALARPRHRASMSFAALEMRVRAAMRADVAATPASGRPLAPVIPIGHLRLAA